MPLRGDGRGRWPSGSAAFVSFAARLSQRTRRTTKGHKGLPEWETQISQRDADFWRAGARGLLDYLEITKATKDFAYSLIS